MSATDFFTYADRMAALLRIRGLGVFGNADRRYRFEVPVVVWETARAFVAGQYGWKRGPRPQPGDHLFGYPVRVNDKLRPGELLLAVEVD